MTKTILTPAGIKKMQEDIKRIKSVEMKEAIDALTEAREKGDSSENPEYESAKEHYDILNLKLQMLGQKLSNSIVIDPESVDTSSVQILTTVKVKNMNTKKDNKFTIVPENEVDIKSGKISFNSPIGKGLIGKMVGEKVIIEAPSGPIKLKVLDITI